MKNRTITSKIKRLTAYMNYNRFHLFRLKDNSYDYDYNLLPHLINIDFRELNELTVYKSLIQNKISDFHLLFIDIWYDTFNEIISKYPICDTYYYFIETMKLLNSYGIIDVHYKEEPTFLNIQFVSASYSKVTKIHNSYEEFEGVLIRLEYYWGEAIQTYGYFDKITVYSSQFVFGKFSPTIPGLEYVVKLLIVEAFNKIRIQ